MKRLLLRFRDPAKLWSSEDLRQLRELAAQQMPLALMAVQLNRSTSAIRNKAQMHGISLRRCGPAQPAAQSPDSQAAPDTVPPSSTRDQAA